MSSGNGLSGHKVMEMLKSKKSYAGLTHW